MFDAAEQNLIVELAGAGSCSLDSSPKKNWVEKGGGLPDYICRIARALIRAGHPKGQAIAIAISRSKHWAAGGSTNGRGGAKVHKDTQAKAAGAVAQWNALKARAHGKHAVSLSHGGENYVMLTSAGAFNTRIVSEAWEDARRAFRYQSDVDEDYSESAGYIEELWTDHIIVCSFDDDGSNNYYRVNYTVDNGQVAFGVATPVQKTYTPIPASADPDNDGDIDIDAPLTDNEKELLSDIFEPKTDDVALSHLLAAFKKD